MTLPTKMGAEEYYEDDEYEGDEHDDEEYEYEHAARLNDSRQARGAAPAPSERIASCLGRFSRAGAGVWSL